MDLPLLTPFPSRHSRRLRLGLWLLGLSGAGTLAALLPLGSADLAPVLAARLALYAILLGGAGGLSVLLHPESRPPQERDLARKGLVRPPLVPRLLGLARLLFSFMAFPSGAITLVALAIAPTPESALAALKVLLVSLLGFAALALLLGGLGCVSERLLPRFPRTTALALALLLIVPSALTPSLPGLFSPLQSGVRLLFEQADSGLLPRRVGFRHALPTPLLLKVPA